MLQAREEKSSSGGKDSRIKRIHASYLGSEKNEMKNAIMMMQ